MDPIFFIDRLSGTVQQEHVYGENAIKFIYGKDLISKLIGTPLLHTLVKTLFLAKLYGWWQNLSFTKKKIQPFIETFHVDTSEFVQSPTSFRSFNDFFIRRLKPEARPIAAGDDVAVIPADGRYYFYENIEQCDGFIVKGQKFSLSELLQDEALAKKYASGSMVMARLCPSDYHRFHFPCAGIPSEVRLINGWLYSVNPIAIKKNISFFVQNKRTLCEIESPAFGKVIYMDIGATFVGSIHQTYIPNQLCAKGSEKGYFAFGGSSLILLFPPNTITFEPDLLAATERGMEIRCLLGQAMGHAK